MNNLRVACVQPDLFWLEPHANLLHLSTMLQDLPSTTDIVVLPEMFTSGFIEKPEPLFCSSYNNHSAIRWMCEQASLFDIAIVGSVACELPSESSTSYVNRLLFVTPDGLKATYDKCHLFSMGGEHKRYQAGAERSIVSYKGWRFLLTICYDIRFPVFCRNQNDYDLILCVANWPKPRRHAWRTLLQARAIENQAYVVGVNRVGVDGKGLVYSGDSMIVDYYGNPQVDGHNEKESILSAELSMRDQCDFRDSFPVWRDADSFKLV